MHQVFHAFTTTLDGNLAYHVPDTKENVDKNRIKMSQTYKFDINKLYYMNQVHGNNVIIVDENSPKLIDNCDAIITNQKDFTLMVMVADCIPILMFDKQKGVIAAIHAGRNSTFLKISQITAKKMLNQYGCKVDDIEVILGPSIQKCCYEVNLELANIVKTTFGEEFEENRYIDLQGINKKLLIDLGIKNIKISDICTKCSNQPFFSYRVDKNCGRFAGIISLKN